MNQIGFGGGCHWCTEAVFQNLRGITQAEQGFIKSSPPHDSFSEAVIASYDAAIIPLTVLMEIHLRTHSSRSDHKMRGKYRSAIYVFEAAQALEVQAELSRLQSDFDNALVTQILDCAEFKPSDERFKNYYRKDPERPFCKTYIDPKLKLLRDEYSHYAKA